MTTAHEIEHALRNELPADLHAQVPRLAQVLADALGDTAPAMTDDSVLSLLQSLTDIPLLLGDRQVVVKAVTGDQIDAPHAQGFINRPSGPVLQVFVNAPPQPVPPAAPLMAPAPPDDFVPRPHEFNQLLAHLCSSDSGPVAITAALAGAGGFGKTTLAQALCHDARVRAAFPDGILWVTLGEHPGDLTGRLNGLAATLTGEHPHISDEHTAAAHLAEVMGEKTLLLVIDDLWDKNHLQPFLRAGPRCTRLVTTRNRGTLPRDTHRVDVDAMRQYEAVALLSTGLDAAPAHTAALHALVTRLGEWPLLLRLVNGTLTEQVDAGMSLDAALAFVEAGLDEEGISAFNLEEQAGRNAAVDRMLAVSLRLLTDDEQARYAELAAFPEDVDIPLATVTRYWQATGALSGFKVQKLCSKLARLSLLLRCDLEQGTILLHDVVRLCLHAQHTDLPALHAALLDAHRPTDGWPALPADEPYLWHHLAEHLADAGHSDELAALLTDFGWLQAKLEATETNALLADYDALKPLPAPHRLVRDALRLSSHVLAEETTQLAAQLTGRLLSFDDPAIAALLAQAAEWKAAPWLCPLHACLTSPGGPLVRTLTGHTSGILSCALSMDGTVALSASEDDTLKVWDMLSGQVRHTLGGHTRPVWGCALNADGTLALSASADRTLKVWNAISGQVIHTLTGHTDWIRGCALSADGTVALSASLDRTLKVWNATNGQVIHTLSGHTDWVRGCALSADGTLALSVSRDGMLKVWDATSGQVIHTLTGHTHTVRGCALSADGTLALSVSRDGMLKVWDATSGQVIHTLNYTSEILGCALSADGTLALSTSADGMVRMWDTLSGQEIYTLTGHTDAVWGCALSADGNVALSASEDKTLKVWYTTRGQLRHTINDHTSEILSCALSADGTLALSTSADRTLKVWNAISGQVIHTLTGHTDWIRGCALSADGTVALSASFDHTLKVWNATNGQVIHTLTGHTSGVDGCALSADGTLALSTSADRTVKVWDVLSEQVIHTLADHTDIITGCCALSANGTLALSALDDRTVKVWDTLSGQVIHTLIVYDQLVSRCALSADGTLALSVWDDGILRVWDTFTGKELRTFTGHTDLVRSVTVLADGQRALSAAADRTLKLWDIATGACLLTFHSDSAFLCCAISADGRTVVAGDTAGGVYFLRLEGLA
jgi:WD40 repeat protein